MTGDNQSSCPSPGAPLNRLLWAIGERFLAPMGNITADEVGAKGPTGSGY